MNSLKTTVLGVLTIVAALAVAGKALLDGDPQTTVNLELLAGGIAAGLGLILARDNSRSSESVGAG